MDAVSGRSEPDPGSETHVPATPRVRSASTAGLVEPEDAHWLADARDTCANVLDTILSGGVDPHARIARFGPEAAGLAHNSAAT